MLTGFLENLPLTCGQVVTYANVFVGEQAPFDLLLGRPWQRGNFVCIDERLDGTYLLFKDAEMQVRYEVLVSPEQIVRYDPEIAEYLSQTHNFMCRMEALAAAANRLESAPTVPVVALATIEHPLGDSIMELQRYLWQQQILARQSWSYPVVGAAGPHCRDRPVNCAAYLRAFQQARAGFVDEIRGPAMEATPSPTWWSQVHSLVGHGLKQLSTWIHSKDSTKTHSPMAKHTRANILLALDYPMELVSMVENMESSAHISEISENSDQSSDPSTSANVVQNCVKAGLSFSDLTDLDNAAYVLAVTAASCEEYCKGLTPARKPLHRMIKLEEPDGSDHPYMGLLMRTHLSEQWDITRDMERANGNYWEFLRRRTAHYDTVLEELTAHRIRHHELQRIKHAVAQRQEAYSKNAQLPSPMATCEAIQFTCPSCAGQK